jgi:hypothetical protein
VQKYEGPVAEGDFSEVSTKSQDGGGGGVGGREILTVYISYYFFHDTQSRVTALHTFVAEVTRLKSR